MKKNLLLIVLLSLSMVTFAQITITNNDIANTGRTFLMANDTVNFSSIVPGDPGVNLTWDFTGVNASYNDTINIVEPGTTPFADNFPNANYSYYVSLADSTLLYSYMVRSDDKFTSKGAAYESSEVGTIITNINPEEIILDFPVNYLDNYSEAYSYFFVIESPMPGADSIKVKTDITKETTVDAWGSITTTLGTYDALRQHITDVQTDSTFMLLAGTWMFVSATEVTSSTYDWWTNNSSIGTMLFSIDVDDAGNTLGVSFYNGTAVGLDENKNIESKVFPNPVTDLLNIDFAEVVTGSVSIINQMGQVILRKELTSQNNAQINMANLTNGVYIYQINNEFGDMISNGKIIKQ